MILHRLRHAGTFAFPTEVVIDFDTLPTLLAVHGPNGAGKTTLLDVMMAPLLGEFPYRPGALSRHFVTKGAIDLTWSMDGVAYRSLLKVDPSLERTEGTLWRGTDVVAGPLIRDYRRAVEPIIGPPELVLAAAYSVQSGIGAFLRLPKADRRALLADLLGLARYPRLADGAKTRGATVERDLTTIRARVADLEAQAAQGAALQTELTAARHEYETALARRGQAEDGLRRARHDLTEAHAAWAALTPVQAQVQRLTRDVAALATKRADLDGRRANNAALLAEAPTIRAAVAEDARLATCRVTLDRDLDLAQTALREAQAVVQARRLVEQDVTHGRATVARLGRQAGLLGTVPCHGAGPYADCPLIGEATAARSAVGEAQATLAALEARLAAWPTTTPPDPTAPLLAQRATLEAERTTLAPLVAKAEKVGAATARLEELDRALATLAETEGETVIALAAATEQLRAMPARQEAVQVAQRAVNAAEQDRHLAEQDVTRWSQTLGRLEGQIAAFTAAAEQATALKTGLPPLEIDLADWALLAKAFGPTGIPTLLIDQALPELSTLATDLLRECLGESLFTITLSTQRDASSGDKRIETLDVIVTRGGDPVDAAVLSGGEAVLVSEALSLALACYVATRTGRRIETLLRDEVGAALDVDRAPAYARLLRRAAALGGFRHVLYVSHQPRAIELADASLEVRQGAITLG
jgi:exonuclease SbcC